MRETKSFTHHSSLVTLRSSAPLAASSLRTTRLSSSSQGRGVAPSTCPAPSPTIRPIALTPQWRGRSVRRNLLHSTPTKPMIHRRAPVKLLILLALLSGCTAFLPHHYIALGL